MTHGIRCPHCNSDDVNVEFAHRAFPHYYARAFCVNCYEITDDLPEGVLDEAVRAISLFGVVPGLTDTEEFDD